MDSGWKRKATLRTESPQTLLEELVSPGIECNKNSGQKVRSGRESSGESLRRAKEPLETKADLYRVPSVPERNGEMGGKGPLGIKQIFKHRPQTPFKGVEFNMMSLQSNSHPGH